ncbi:MAG: hypothetical protein M3Y08_02340 [Fibrobacterota bacterium]|nr:hypothetical protein [Fibrobacterota bacterium]
MLEISGCRAEILRRESAIAELQRRLESDLRPLETRMLEVRVDTLRVLGGHLRSGRLNRRAAKLLESALYDLANALEKEHGLDLEQDRIHIFEAYVPPAETDEADEGKDWEDEDEERTGYYRESDFKDKPKRESSDRPREGFREQPQESARSGQETGSGTHGSSGKAGSKRAAQKENRDEVIAGDIRALYLMLARALHPDKESDPARLADKTRWMQRVTAAYANRDLAMLLDILASNPLDAVGPYLSQAPLKTVQGFAKRLRRELDTLRARMADPDWKLDPFLAKFIRGAKVNETAFSRYVAEVSKQLKFMKQRRDMYKTSQGVNELVEALRSHPWNELL